MNKYNTNFEYENRGRNNSKRGSTDFNTTGVMENDISKKIKSLEIEGLKLRNQVESILQESYEISSHNGESTNESDSNRTLPDYRDHHDRKFGGDFNNAASRRNNPKGRIFSSYNKDDEQIILQQELDEYREQMEIMEHRLKQETNVHRNEVDRLTSVINDLKQSKLALQSELDRYISGGHNRDRKYDSIIERLRNALSELTQINKDQEETLLESSKKLALLENSQTSISAVQRLKEMLVEIEYYRGSSFIKDCSVDSSSPNMIVNMFDRYLKELNSDLIEQNHQIKKLEDELSQEKRNMTREKEKSLTEFRTQVAYLEEQNNYLKRRMDDISENSEIEIKKLKEENLMIKNKMEDEVNNATTVIDGLESNLQELSNKFKQSMENWQTEKKSFEKLLDESEKLVVVSRADRDQAQHQKSSILAKLDATQNKLNETENQLLQMQSEKYSYDKQVELLKKRNKELEVSLSSTRVCLENITKAVETSSTCKISSSFNYEDGQSDSQLTNDDLPWKPRKYEVEQIIFQIKATHKKILEASEKYNESQKDIERLSQQLEAVTIQKKKLEQSLSVIQLDFESLKNENCHINSLIASRNGEIERLTAERDYYFQMLSEKTEEFASVKSENHRLAATLEERCRQLETLNSNSSNNFNQNVAIDSKSNSKLIDVAVGKTQVFREERNRLTAQLNDMKSVRDELLSSQKDQTMCIQLLRTENANLQAELKNIQRDYDELLVENKRLKIKVKEANEEITTLCSELQNKSADKSRKHCNLEKKLVDMNDELTKNRSELKISRDRIRDLEKLISKTKNNTSHHPVVLNEIVATEKNLPDVDHLSITKNRLSALERQMEIMEDNHKGVREENSKLTDLLKKVTCQNERLTEQLQTYVEENKTLRSQTSKFHIKSESKSDEIKSSHKPSNSSNVEKPKRYHSDRFTDTNKEHEQETINKLRNDLQDSIMEANRLLSKKSFEDLLEKNISSDTSNTSSKSSESTTYKIQMMPVDSKSGLNNNNPSVSSSRSTEKCDASTPSTLRSDSGSMTEVDRHLVNKKQISKIENFKRSESPVDKLLTSVNRDRPPNSYERKSNRDSYILEEKIKRILEES